jgi:hypothetical protein
MIEGTLRGITPKLAWVYGTEKTTGRQISA